MKQLKITGHYQENGSYVIDQTSEVSSDSEIPWNDFNTITNILRVRNQGFEDNYFLWDSGFWDSGYLA